MNNFDLINVPEDTLDRLLMGKATDGDQLLAHNAILSALKAQTPARVVSDSDLDRASRAAHAAYFDDEGPSEVELACMRNAVTAALSTLQSGAEGKDGDARDAERYRYLRARMIPEELTESDMAIQCQRAMGPIIGRKPDIDPYVDSDFDATIDTALQPGLEG